VNVVSHNTSKPIVSGCPLAHFVLRFIENVWRQSAAGSPLLLTGQSTSHVADYSHLSADADEEVRQLQDYLETLREVRLDA
jgi:hypothetical protein